MNIKKTLMFHTVIISIVIMISLQTVHGQIAEGIYRNLEKGFRSVDSDINAFGKPTNIIHFSSLFSQFDWTDPNSGTDLQFHEVNINYENPDRENWIRYQIPSNTEVVTISQIEVESSGNTSFSIRISGPGYSFSRNFGEPPDNQVKELINTYFESSYSLVNGFELIKNALTESGEAADASEKNIRAVTDKFLTENAHSQFLKIIHTDKNSLLNCQNKNQAIELGLLLWIKGFDSTYANNVVYHFEKQNSKVYINRAPNEHSGPDLIVYSVWAFNKNGELIWRADYTVQRKLNLPYYGLRLLGQILQFNSEFINGNFEFLR